MHLVCDHLYIYSINFEIRQIPATIFPGNNKPFSIKPTVVWVKISEKNKHEFFRFEVSIPQVSK